jgi:NADH dehydrogenase [ubiquinone] 1 alpha subcomplex assembly factor 1
MSTYPGLLASLLLLAASGAGRTEDRVLFDFTQPEQARQWQSVNDGVMGGRSSGRATMTAQQTLLFEGNLSLANNGGFASIRTRPSRLALTRDDVLIVRVRGDGREYSMNLYVPGRQTAFSFRANFQTVANQWVEIELPLDRFVATSFGRELPSVELDPRTVNGLGILLGDKRAGPFRLEIDSIRVRSPR